MKAIYKKNNRGFSLVELMIVVGMLGGLSLVVMNITKQSNKSSTKFQFDSDVTLTTNEINGILSDPAKCLTALGSTATPTNINGKYYTTASGSAPANGYGNSGLKITSYALTGIAPAGVLTIAYENKKILKGSTGPTSVSKIINVYIEGAPGAITKCRSLSTSTTDIWSRGTGSAIYYNGGNIGIGLTIPTTRLHVGGNLQVDGTINATGTITSASDKRLKKDFTSLEGSLEKILSLRGVGFSWRDKNFGKGRQVGFIAQEVEEIYPELVHTNSKGIKSIAYQNLVAPLVEAIRDQQIQIETLQTALCENNPSLKFCKKQR
ncbi:MAG: tail fiber domain-containing protein [Bacteriovorax sp.]|nr:tail fiber domain-containing protein [Bacteriovorax sp.]